MAEHLRNVVFVDALSVNKDDFHCGVQVSVVLTVGCPDADLSVRILLVPQPRRTLDVGFADDDFFLRGRAFDHCDSVYYEWTFTHFV
ncbi:hypothetical protein PQR37_25665 [Paraburkholderia nemoris]|uniref:hypothetical protein n=1 Tax=Paraburkholderia nemoris TaxID=2793076 RepID=UPI0038B8AE5D